MCCFYLFIYFFFWVAIFLSKIVRFLLHPVVGMFSCYPLPIVDRIVFHCFGKSCFVRIVLPFVDISLIFLLSPALSGLFPQVVLFFFPVLPVPFSRLFQRLSFFSFWLVIVVFFYLRIIIIITIISYSLEFFTSVLADGPSLEFEWQQVSSSL